MYPFSLTLCSVGRRWRKRLSLVRTRLCSESTPDELLVAENKKKTPGQYQWIWLVSDLSMNLISWSRLTCLPALFVFSVRRCVVLVLRHHIVFLNQIRSVHTTSSVSVRMCCVCICGSALLCFVSDAASPSSSCVLSCVCRLCVVYQLFDGVLDHFEPVSDDALGVVLHQELTTMPSL